MNNITVLVVDDESRMRKLIKDFLAQKGYSILEAGDGEEALQVYEENKSRTKIAWKKNIQSQIHLSDDFAGDCMVSDFSVLAYDLAVHFLFQLQHV